MRVHWSLVGMGSEMGGDVSLRSSAQGVEYLEIGGVAVHITSNASCHLIRLEVVSTQGAVTV